MENDKPTAIPSLIENNTRYYLQHVLQKCNHHRANIYQGALNIGVFVIFIVVLATVLYCCYKSKRTPEQIKEKELEDQAYVLSKIRHYKQERNNIASRASITGLPMADTRPI
jgi:hypothetical protein